MRIRFYTTVHGRSPIEEFISQLPEETQREMIDALLLLEQGVNLAMPLSRNLSSIKTGLHELRFRDRIGQVRLFYYIKTGEAIHALHAFRKKSRETPKKEIALAVRRIKEI